MFFRQRFNPDSSISYLFGCIGRERSMAVDVLAGDEQWFLDEAQRMGAPLHWVVDTHLHADHRSGGATLAQLAGTPYVLHESAAHAMRLPFQPVRHGDVLDVGNVAVQVLHTPGHTEESMCLLVTDRRRGDTPWFVVTGDTMFVGGVGRPDLAGRERQMATMLHRSLHAHLLSLPDFVEIFPGHQAGSACGAGLSGKPSSTIGFEKRWNAALGLGCTDFVEALIRDLPPPPTGMHAHLEYNTGAATP
jgi:glyoxylase-like metal-dependent hydrolase (beta-lactamase superfamily II)